MNRLFTEGVVDGGGGGAGGVFKQQRTSLSVTYDFQTFSDVSACAGEAGAGHRT